MAHGYEVAVSTTGTGMPPSGPPLQVADRYAAGARAGDDDRHGEAA